MTAPAAAKKKVLAILANEQLAVVSTLGKDIPESALVAFVEDEALNIYFQTNRYSRKVKNLRSHSGVSFVFGLTLEGMTTVQYEGSAVQLSNPNEIELLKKRFIAKRSPTTEKYFDDPTSIFFKVTPTWIGCSGYKGSKPEVFEIKAF